MYEGLQKKKDSVTPGIIKFMIGLLTLSLTSMIGFSGQEARWLTLETQGRPALHFGSVVLAETKRPMTGQESFGLAVCREVPRELVAGIIGKTVEATADFSGSKETGCRYYTNKVKGQHLLIQVTYMNAERQKKGHQAMKRSITTDARIPMDHFIAVQKDGKTINAIYLVMAPEKYVRIDRTSRSVANENQMIDLAVKVSNLILFK